MREAHLREDFSHLYDKKFELENSNVIKKLQRACRRFNATKNVRTLLGQKKGSGKYFKDDEAVQTLGTGRLVAINGTPQ
jgi:hypothetical protein